MKTLTKIIRGVMVYWVVFVAVAWIAFFARGEVPDTLVQYGLGGGAVELAVGGAIEVMKNWAEKKFGGGQADDSTDVSVATGDSDGGEQPADTGDQEGVG